MTTQPAAPRWSQMSWHARQQAFGTLARRHRELAEQVARLETRKLELDLAIKRAEGDLARAVDNIDLRHESAWRRVIWGDESLWSDVELKAAHSAYTRTPPHLRDEWTIVGQRIYDKRRNAAARERKRKQELRVECPSCGGVMDRGAAECGQCRELRRAS